MVDGWEKAACKQPTKTALDYSGYFLFTERPTSILPEIQQTIANLLLITVSSTLVTNWYTYSAWGRQTAAVDGRGNITAYLDDSGVVVVTYTYDTLGRTVVCWNIYDNAVDRFKNKVKLICDYPNEAVEKYCLAANELNDVAKKCSEYNEKLGTPEGSHGH